ncbi:hypothetical protein [Corynebacterium camporealensis]|nr:hypothetical protein [Corynebacterium camporealensis]MDY5841166.1 hypothetical protein [Corynebacterium camporealensis]
MANSGSLPLLWCVPLLCNLGKPTRCPRSTPFLVVLIALSSATFKAANKQDKAPIAMIVMLIVLTVLAYLFPEERGYAASLTIAGVVLVLAFLALRGKSAQTVNQAH